MPDVASGASAAGQVIAGKYKVLHLLARGGMGDVVAAEHLHLKHIVAIKFLSAQTSYRPEVVARFLLEARATVRLRSEHVTRVFDMGTLEGGLPYIVMELLEGRDFEQLLQASGRMTVAETASFLLQACEALAEAHGAGIVHRDLKPSNLFLTRRPDGAPFIKVLDFGISKIAEELGGENLTTTTDVLGTPAYMAPEQIKSAKLVDQRTDIWALGLILIECVTGIQVYRSTTKLGVLAMILSEPLPRLGLDRIDAPGLEEIALRCLEKDPANRFQSVAEFAAALAPFAGDEAGLSADRIDRMLKASRTRRKWTRGSALKRGALGATVGLVLSAGLYAALPRSDTTTTTTDVIAPATPALPTEPAASRTESAAATESAPPIFPKAAPGSAPSAAESLSATGKAAKKEPVTKSTERGDARPSHKAATTAPTDGLEDRK
jgi:serine/threonine protein kinase